MSRTLHTTKPITACPYCADTAIIKKGTRKNKFGAVQLYACKRCQKKFTPLLSKHKTFPIKIILDALTLYNRLHTKANAARAVSKKYGITVHPQNITADAAISNLQKITAYSAVKYNSISACAGTHLCIPLNNQLIQT